MNTQEQHRTYSISIKGETTLYSGPEVWQALSADELCRILGDLTGYRADFLRKALPQRFDKLGYAGLTPANGFGEVPTFAIRSSDGGAMEPLEVKS